MLRWTRIALALLATTALAGAAEDDKLPPLRFKARLVCFIGPANSGSSCGGEMGRTGSMTCGWKGAVSEIRWTYRGQKGGKDLYHVVRRFPIDSGKTTTREVDVSFNGKRQILFEDKMQCITLDPPPVGK